MRGGARRSRFEHVRWNTPPNIDAAVHSSRRTARFLAVGVGEDVGISAGEGVDLGGGGGVGVGEGGGGGGGEGGLLGARVKASVRASARG